MMLSTKFASIDGDGNLTGSGNYVILEPETWVGKPIPILDYIDIADELSKGEWLVMFYHSACPKCREMASRLATCSVPQHLALISVPAHGGWLGGVRTCSFRMAIGPAQQREGMVCIHTSHLAPK